MVLRRLRVRDFRNYVAAQVDLAAGTAVVHGGNGQGKTNLLEAIVLACRGRTLRPAGDAQLVRWGCEFGAARVEATSPLRGELQLEVRIAEGRRQILINGVRRRPAQLIGLAPVVCFAVDDVDIVKGEPGARRRFLNLEMGGQSRSYHFGLLRYNRALEQRNRLLKEMRNGAASPQALDPWDEQLAQAGAQLVAKRARFLGQLGPLWSEAYGRIGGSSPALALCYRPALGETQTLEGAPDGADLERSLLAGLGRAREEDTARGLTTVGPHRDEVEFGLEGRSLREFGSQGEQRTAAIALRLALAGWIAGQQDEPPVLLLDDVLSELDAGRRRGLLEAGGAVEQTIITCTDLEAVPEAVRREAAVIHVEGGAVGVRQPVGEGAS